MYSFYRLGFISFLTIGTAIDLVGLAGLDVFFQSSVVAQIVPDQTLGAESSIVKPNDVSQSTIEGGATRGENLFHSFKQFNIGEGRRVYFNNPSGIERIFGRVTGSSISKILGTLGVSENGTADLFLVNPNGIIFGPEATLDIKGSFLATTASSLRFEDGTQFSAEESSPPSLLTVSLPIGLQFRKRAGNIIQQPTSNGLLGQPGESLALVGGNISLQGGYLEAPGGRIELGSVAEGSVSLHLIQKGWALSYEGVQAFRDIDLIQFAFLEVTDFENQANNGDVQLQGRNLTIKDGSQILGTEGTMKLIASETVEIAGFDPESPTIFSGLQNAAIADEDAGSVTIEAERLIVRDGGLISTESSGLNSSGDQTIATGDAGDLTVNASESVELIGDKTGLISSTSAFGSGGGITINTQNLTIRNGASISAESTGRSFFGQPITTGQAGSIKINANTLLLDQGLITVERSGETGEGANIDLNISDLLRIENGSLISARADGSANGGNIEIDTPLLIAFPPTGLNGSDVTADAAEGNGGNIDIMTDGIFGIEERRAIQGNQANDIDASSRFGLEGEIRIVPPEIDPSQGLVELPETVLAPSAQIAQTPCQQDEDSEFVVTGRGGLPSRPNDVLSSEATGVGLVDAAPVDRGIALEQESREAEEKVSSTPSVSQTIKPAQGWIFNDKGEVILTAHSPTNPQRLPRRSGCSKL